MTRQEDGRFGLEVDAETDKLMRRAAFASTEHRYDLTPTPTDAELIERLRQKAQAASEASKLLADAKTARQADREDYPDAPGYSWAKPEQTLEWQAADRLTSLSAQIEELRAALRDIAMAQRLGTATDLLSWQSLANACQTTARQALGAQP